MKLILIITFLISLSTTAQEFTCADFKNGTFIMPANEEIPLSYKIIRNGNSQIEIVEDPEGILPLEFQKKQYVTIEWLDDCSYRAKYIEDKMELSEFHQLVNNNNGMLTEMVKIEDSCYYYRSSLTLENETKILEGKLCLE